MGVHDVNSIVRRIWIEIAEKKTKNWIPLYFNKMKTTKKKNAT